MKIEEKLFCTPNHKIIATSSFLLLAAASNGGMDMIEYHYNTSFAKYYYFDGAQKPVLHLRGHYGTCNVIVF